MIKTEFCLLQMKKECLFWDSVEFHQTLFGIAPKWFDAVDVTAAVGKFIMTMPHPKMLWIANIHQTVIATPAVRMDDTFNGDVASYNLD